MNIGGRIVPEMEELSVSFNSSTFMFGVDVVIRYTRLYVLYNVEEKSIRIIFVGILQYIGIQNTTTDIFKCIATDMEWRNQ